MTFANVLHSKAHLLLGDGSCATPTANRGGQLSTHLRADIGREVLYSPIFYPTLKLKQRFSSVPCLIHRKRELSKCGEHLSPAPLKIDGKQQDSASKLNRPEADTDLVARCQNGERAAQQQLYQRHKDWVFNLAYRMANHQQEAEDIAQKVFIQVFRRIDSFRGEAAFSSWLYRLTMNVCINHFHKEKRRKTHIMNELDAAQAKAGKSEDIDLKPHLERAIRALPEGYRMVFILHDIEGFNHQEIGEMMNCSEGTSKSQLHKARKELRQVLMPFLRLQEAL